MGIFLSEKFSTGRPPSLFHPRWDRRRDRESMHHFCITPGPEMMGPPPSALRKNGIHFQEIALRGTPFRCGSLVADAVLCSGPRRGGSRPFPAALLSAHAWIGDAAGRFRSHGFFKKPPAPAWRRTQREGSARGRGVGLSARARCGAPGKSRFLAAGFRLRDSLRCSGMLGIAFARISFSVASFSLLKLNP